MEKKSIANVTSRTLKIFFAAVFGILLLQWAGIANSANCTFHCSSKCMCAEGKKQSCPTGPNSNYLTDKCTTVSTGMCTNTSGTLMAWQDCESNGRCIGSCTAYCRSLSPPACK